MSPFPKPKVFLSFPALFMATILLTLSAFGWSVPAAAEETVLKIQPPGDGAVIEITEQQVRQLPPITIETLDPWDNRKRTYTGCDFLDFLNQMGFVDFGYVEVIAKNDFRARITRDDLEAYNYLLTYAMDGKDYADLGEEDKGPLALAAEIESVDPKDKLKVKNQMVWWIDRLIVN